VGELAFSLPTGNVACTGIGVFETLFAFDFVVLLLKKFGKVKLLFISTK